MSKQYPGGVISKSGGVPTSVSAPGIWSLSDQAAAQATNSWPFVRDPQFNYVTMLLHGEGSALRNTNRGAGVTPTVLPFNSDASTNNFTFAINGAAQSNVFNPYQAGYYSNYFTGVSDYLGVSTITLGSSYTIEFFVNFPTAPSSNNIILGNPASGGGTYWIGITSSTLSFSYSGTTRTFAFTAVAGTWYYFQIIVTGSTVSAYVNGSQIGTTQTGPTTFLIDRIGGYASNGFTGYLSNLRITNAANAVSATPTTPLTAITNCVLLTCQSNRFIDNSASPYTLTPSGSISVSSAQPFTLPSSVETYGSAYFDGAAGTYLETPYNSALDASTGPFTYEAWLNPSTTTNKQYLGGSVTNAFFAFIGSGTIFVGRNNVAVDFTSNATIKINQWNHVVIVRNASNNIAIFINGTREYYAASNTNNYGLASNSLRIGVGTTGSSYEYNGYISNVRIAKSALYDPTVSTLTVPTEPLTAGSAGLLTAQYNGAATNNEFEDSSKNNFPVTKGGTTAQGTFSPYGSNWSNYFDGNGDYLSTADSTSFAYGTGDCTVECWFFPISTPSNQVIIDQRESSPSGGGFSIECTSNLIPYVATSVVFLSGTIAMTINAWNHIAYVRSGTTLSLFVNGVRSNTASNSTNLTSQRLTIGAYTSRSSSYAQGYISNVRLIKGTAAYSPSSTTLTVPTAPLTAITNTSLLTCADNRFVDDSTNNFTITRSGDVRVQRFSPFINTASYSPNVIGGSAYFNGSSDYLQIPYNSALVFGTNDFTVECWVMFNDISTGMRRLLGLGYGANGSGPVTTSWQIVYMGSEGSNQIRFYRYDGSTETYYDTSGFSPSNNTWYHIAVSRVGGSLYIFVNGVALYSAANTFNYSAVTTSDPFLVGLGYYGPQSGYNGPRFFNGYITDVRVINGDGLYSSTFALNTSPLENTSKTVLLLNNTNAGILDYSMSNDLKTIGNIQLSTSIKKFGNASMYFDGTGDWLSVLNNDTLNMRTGDFTIECWINRTATTSSPNTADVFYGKGSNNLVLSINISAGTFRADNYGVGSLLASTTVVSNNTWYHFALTRSGTTLRMFVNGTLEASTTSSADFSSTTDLFIGGDPSNTNQRFYGYIDDLRITKGVARYTSNFSVPTEAFPNG